MQFSYIIIFRINNWAIVRAGEGFHYPHDGGFNLEHMLWQMTEEFGRPTGIEVKMSFTGGEDGKTEG